MYIFIQVIILDISAKMMYIVEKEYNESACNNENVDLLLTIANNIRFIFWIRLQSFLLFTKRLSLDENE